MKTIMVLLAGCLFAAWGGPRGLRADQNPSLIVHFQPGKAELSASDKSELRKLFQSYTLGSQSRVFVVGYTDGTGGKSENRKLSRQRAQNVRRTIIADYGIDARTVMALGKGIQTPLGDNKTAKGRALNRRVEIFLANGQARTPKPAFGSETPHWSEITQLVREAEDLIKARRMADALKKLKKARALGADGYSQWQAVFGIAGYYADAAMEETRAHLVAALKLDPYNSDAREYLSRVDARLKVARAEVTRDMGRSAETAIAVTDPAQQYEYLRLFEVEPQAHRALEGRPVDMWQCTDRQGAPIVYYFNHAAVFGWAFSGSASPEIPPVARLTRFREPEPAPPADARPPVPRFDNGSERSGKQVQGKPIWQSKLFK